MGTIVPDNTQHVGEMYQAYYEQNRYRLLNESGMEEATPKGWSHDQVINKIIHHYRHRSPMKRCCKQANRPIQKHTPCKRTFHQITLIPLRFLSCAIDALQHSEYDVIRPMQEYVPMNSRLMAACKRFWQHSALSHTDTLNPQREAILTMQKLIQTLFCHSVQIRVLRIGK